jgi:AcrR family transcriptional regulator
MVKRAGQRAAAKDSGVEPAMKLSNARIVAAAMRIADREGLQAISIRRIAEELDAGTMSLYRHVEDKDQLLDLLLDEAYSEISVPDAPSGDWRQDLRELARQTRAVLKRHWWLGPLLTSRPTLGANYLRWFEYQLATVGTVVKDMKARTRVIGTVFAYVTGVVGYELGEQATNRRHGLTEERKREFARPILEPILATGRYPNLAQFIEQGTGESSDEDFEFGLDCVLGGVGARIDAAKQTEAEAVSKGREPNRLD